MDTGLSFLGLVGVLAVVVFGIIIAVISRYKKCPPDKILVISGKIGRGADGHPRSAKCIHGGAAFVIPLIQESTFLSLTPIAIDVPLSDALSRQNIRISVPSTFTVGISTDPHIMQNAAERLLGLKAEQIKQVASDILFGQLRVVVATMDIEHINSNRDKFVEEILKVVDVELNKVGLRVINVNINDINDKSGYIEALGKKAAAQAVNEAKIEVANKDRDGEVGQAVAKQDQRVRVAAANATAVGGENTATIEIANSNSARQVAQAEAARKATAAEKVASAKALEEAFGAEREAELARATREQATRQADIIVPQEIEKQKIVIAAEATAAQAALAGKGEGDKVYNEMSGRAKGIKEVLEATAEGLKAIVSAAGNDPDKAARLIIVNQLKDIVGEQVKAIQNVKFDKVVVWDSGNGKNSGIQGWGEKLLKVLPGLAQIAELGGWTLPELLGKKATDEKLSAPTATPPAPEAS